MQNGTASFSDVIVTYMILIVASSTLSETMNLAPNVVKSREAVKSVFKIPDRRTQMEPKDQKAFHIKNKHLNVDTNRHKVYCNAAREENELISSLSCLR